MLNLIYIFKKFSHLRFQAHILLCLNYFKLLMYMEGNTRLLALGLCRQKMSDCMRQAHIVNSWSYRCNKDSGPIHTNINYWLHLLKCSFVV